MKSEDEFYAHCQQHHAAAIAAAAVAASNANPGSTATPSSIPCIVCRQTLVSALELTLHARHHYRSNQQPPLQQQASCCVCSTTDGLLAPLCTTVNSVYYICLACERRDGLGQSNVVSSASSKSFQCIKCQQSFASEQEVRLHVATHVLQDGNVHRCRLCTGDVVFDSPARLQAHVVAEHELAGTVMDSFTLQWRKAKIHYTSLPVASPEQVRNYKLARAKSVVSVVSCRYPNSITTTCCQLVADLLRTCWPCRELVGKKSVTSCNFEGKLYGETCVMDFEHNYAINFTCNVNTAMAKVTK